MTPDPEDVTPATTETTERTSLLAKPNSAVVVTEAEPWIAGMAREFVILLKMSVPVILAYTLQNSLQTVSVLVVGRLSSEHLAAAAFSYMFAMSTGLSPPPSI